MSYYASTSDRLRYVTNPVGREQAVGGLWQMIQTLAPTPACYCPNYDDIKTPRKGRESAIAIYDVDLIKLMLMKVFAQL